MRGLAFTKGSFRGITLTRKRQKVVTRVSRKRARKQFKPDVIEGEINSVPVDQTPQREEAGTMPNAQDEPRVKQQDGESISYSGDRGTVSLRENERVAIDGYAMVRLVKGRAAVHGYSLSPEVQILVCSNSKLAAVAAIETKPPPPVVPSASNFGDSQISLRENCGCTLEFTSYFSGATVAHESQSDDGMDVSSQRRTFRIEITKRDEIMAQEAVKRKRADELDGEGLQRSQDLEEEVMTASDDDDERAERGQTDMELDGSSDSESIFSRQPETKKHRQEPRKALACTFIPDSWWAVADSILNQKTLMSSVDEAEQMDVGPVVAVIGPKNAGKSTYSRFLLNFLLNSYDAVGYLDTDIGQPEFTVPGCVSLHIIREPVFGSPVLHLRDPERSFFYGDTSPKSDPEMYTRSARALFAYFQRNYGTGCLSIDDEVRGCKGMPLVINTHGWIKGIGYDVLVDILRHICPTHVVQFTEKTQSKNLPAGKFWERPGDGGKTDLLYLESAMDALNRPLNAYSKIAPEHLRNSRIMAYFRQCFAKGTLPFPYRESKIFAQTASALVNLSPYAVSISCVQIHHLFGHVSQSESLYGVNGALVGLGVSISAPEDNNMLARMHSPCVGVGIVRGVDAEKGLLYILTPLSSDILEEVDTLLHGRVELPVLLLQAKGHSSPYLRHHSVAISKTGSMAMKPQKLFRKSRVAELKATTEHVHRP